MIVTSLRNRSLTARLGVAAAIGCVLLNIAPEMASAQEPRPYGIPGIYTSDRDGANVQLLVRLPDMEWHGLGCLSHDGRVLFGACPRWREFDKARMFMATLDGEQFKELGPGAAPTWSPDARQIAFHMRSENADGLQPGLWLMDAEGNNRRWLADGERPRWSPDGTTVVVTSSHEGFASLYLVNVADGTTKRVLFENYSRVNGGHFAPDGKRVVYIAYRRPGRSELGILKLDSEEPPRIRWKGRIGWQPSWSPDGKDIVFFVINEDGSWHLHRIDPEGDGPPVRLKNQESAYYNSDAQWSPDSRRLIFARAY